MRPYPKELRIRVVAAVEQGEHSHSEIATLFGVGVTFIKKMLRLHRAGNDLAARHGGGASPALKEPERDLLKRQIAEQSDASLQELRQVLAEKRQVWVSQATICCALQELGLPRKKSFFARERDEKSRRQFQQFIEKLTPEQCIFVDEMGSNLAMTRGYARAAPGLRIVGQKSKAFCVRSSRGRWNNCRMR